MDENYNNINIVLKLAVQKDSIYNKNSIITCIPISDKRLQTYKNSKQIVYKKVK